MKVLVVSGFLGAGKTTFIQKLISRSTERLVVLENEFGGTDVDRKIIAKDSGTEVQELTEGCVCCTKSPQLHASVMTIESTVSPDLLIVEPSGVGALGNVMRILRKIEYERITLLPPVTIVDAENFHQNLKLFEEVFTDQLKSSARILISKPENPDPCLYDDIRNRILELNPSASVSERHYSLEPDSWWQSLLNPATVQVGTEPSYAESKSPDLETFTVKNCSVASPVTLLWLLERVVRGECGFIVRAKGILPAGKDWVRFDVVGGRISVEGTEPVAGCSGAECVWIGRGINRNFIEKCINPLRNEVRPFNVLSGNRRNGTVSDAASEMVSH